MPVYTLHVYECDEGECESTVVANSGTEARTKAVQQGWSVFEAEGVRCRPHRTYPTCEECGRPMRPWGAAAALHPGTIRVGSDGWCNVCAENEKKGAGNRVRLDRAVEKYLMFRGPEFAYWYHGADRRDHATTTKKAVPEDLWPILGI